GTGSNCATGTGGGGGDATAPKLTVAGPHKQRLSRTLSMRVGSDEPATLDVGGEVRAGKRGGGLRRLFALPDRHLAVDLAATASWRLTRPDRRHCRRMLRRHRRVDVHLTLTAVDRSGNSAGPQAARIRIVRP